MISSANDVTCIRASGSVVDVSAKCLWMEKCGVEKGGWRKTGKGTEGKLHRCSRIKDQPISEWIRWLDRIAWWLVHGVTCHESRPEQPWYARPSQCINAPSHVDAPINATWFMSCFSVLERLSFLGIGNIKRLTNQVESAMQAIHYWKRFERMSTFARTTTRAFEQLETQGTT
ncbi:hypothetical protein EJ06DRAFT_317464 [Trichodelitschia bisporula]|uniref:Uncharacterized protein n=1 Tax=Trichodelitschia bisporula TaxID=703511 RepID=A0A6G1I4B3_9PEZI|nr:hypothetical protein EJ06DRAFT_317464 [Trichodelitschia bisporula]